MMKMTLGRRRTRQMNCGYERFLCNGIQDLDRIYKVDIL